MNIKLLQQKGTIKTCKEGEMVCMEKETGHTAYLLLQGGVDVVVGSFTENGKTVAALRPGTIFGEMSLLEDKPRTATVVATTDDTRLLEINKENFLEILQADTEIAYQLLRTLYQRMEKCLQEMNHATMATLTNFKTNTIYKQIQGLSQNQFVEIVEKDGNYALTLLKFLSRGLAQIDEEIARQGVRK